MISHNGNNAPVVNVLPDDERMSWAIEKARLTLHHFKYCLAAPHPYQQYFSAKVKIDDGRYAEHLWVSDPSFDEEGNLFGVISNKPVKINRVAENQRIGIDAEHITDWMIIENGRLIGGYTLRAIREGMTDREKDKFDRHIGFYIDEGADHFPHDLSTPEGAILCLEDAYNEHDIEKAVSCKDFYAEAQMLLERMGDRFTDDAVITATAEALQLNFISSLQQEGFPVFRNIARAFPMREKINDELYLITEVCFYPDHTKSIQRLYTSKRADEWRVIHVED